MSVTAVYSARSIFSRSRAPARIYNIIYNKIVQRTFTIIDVCYSMTRRDLNRREDTNLGGGIGTKMGDTLTKYDERIT